MYDVDPSQVVLKSRLKPGRMLLVDTEEKAVIQDIELKRTIAQSRPHSLWLKEQVKNVTEKINLLAIINSSVDSILEHLW